MTYINSGVSLETSFVVLISLCQWKLNILLATQSRTSEERSPLVLMKEMSHYFLIFYRQLRRHNN